jgi:hypothetical protein
VKAKWLIPGVLAVACACPAKQTTGPGSGSNGSGTVVEKPASTCDGLRARVEALYRAEAQANEPKRVEEAVADNTTMVLNDCAKAPDKVVACVNAATTIAELESKCLRPLDDEGTEGTELKK